MSRSRRWTPNFGYTSAESDKWLKTLASRKVRRAMLAGLDVATDGDALPVKRHAVVNPWSSQKDGKRWLAEPRPERLQK
jgi:hypothetical protein